MNAKHQRLLRALREPVDYAHHNKLAVMSGFALTALSILLSLVVPLLSKHIIDDGLVGRDIHLINRFGTLFLIVAALSLGVSALRDYLFAVFQQRMMLGMRARLVHHVLRLPHAHLSRERPGNLMARIDGDVGNFAGFAATTLAQTCFNVLTIVCAVAVLLRLNWRLALLTATLLPVFLLSLGYFTRRSYDFGLATRDAYSEVMSKLEETLSNTLLIKLFHTEDTECSSYVNAHTLLSKTSLETTRISLLSSFTIGSVLAVAPLLVIWYGGLQVVEGRLTIGSLFAFNMYLAYLFGPLRSVYDAVVSFQSSLASFDRVEELRRVTRQDIYLVRSGDERPIVRGEVEIRDLTFGYSSHDTVLRGLSLHAEAGKRTAIVGRSGVGKTTILALLLKLHELYEGAIVIDGRNLKDIGLDALRSGIKLVPQDPLLLNRSVLDNIAYGSPGATTSDIHRAAEIALADDFIRRLPNGYDTVVGHRAVTLSGGERQRLALARALVSNPRILLLDEATAFLDSETEHDVQCAIDNSMMNRTCIVVAHRLNTVLKADNICLLDQGRLQVSGRHSELYSRSAEYRALVDRQFLVDTAVCS